MDWLRKIVSGQRRRFCNENYNLDITYITSRVVAMSFPASGIETAYRNNIADVRILSLNIFRFLNFSNPNMAITTEYSI